jgi:outer membrane protein assembly factor BamB
VRIDLEGGIWSATQLWENTVEMIWMTPVCYDGAVFGPTGNNGSSTTPLVCLDLMTGATRWSYSNFGRGSVTLVNDTIVALSENGWMRLIRPVTNSFQQIAAFRAFTNGSCWNSPAVYDGRLIARSATQAACWDLSMPELRMLTPTVKPDGTTLLLAATTVTGAAVNSNRLAAMDVQGSTDLLGTNWTVLTNRPMLSNGVVQVDNVLRAPGSLRYYRLVEHQ